MIIKKIYYRNKMKKIVLLCSLLFSASAFCGNECFVTKQNDQIISSGKCSQQHSPSSTFKIALSLIANNEGILVDDADPVLDFEEDFIDWVPSWNLPHSTINFVENSCFWYWKKITRTLSSDKIQNYINKFDYGNKDLSGSQKHGCADCWLSSSLQISPIEQVEFLDKLIKNKLQIKATAQKMTKNLLYIEKLNNNWTLYGQTGTGYMPTNSKDTNKGKFSWIFGWLKRDSKKMPFGWFVGWIEKEKKTIPFAYYIDKEDGWFAAEHAKKELNFLIDNMK